MTILKREPSYVLLSQIPPLLSLLKMANDLVVTLVTALFEPFADTLTAIFILRRWTFLNVI